VFERGGMSVVFQGKSEKEREREREGERECVFQGESEKERETVCALSGEIERTRGEQGND
jgi:hypothetical protein